MTLFPISFMVGTIIETSRLLLHMAQAIRISDVVSSGQPLKPAEVLRKTAASLIFLFLFPSG